MRRRWWWWWWWRWWRQWRWRRRLGRRRGGLGGRRREVLAQVNQRAARVAAVEPLRVLEVVDLKSELARNVVP